MNDDKKDAPSPIDLSPEAMESVAGGLTFPDASFASYDSHPAGAPADKLTQATPTRRSQRRIYVGGGSPYYYTPGKPRRSRPKVGLNS